MIKRMMAIQWLTNASIKKQELLIEDIEAASEIEKYSRSVRLVSTQWTYTAEIGGKPAKGINIRIFAIPEIHAR
jgi:hypothetical protein